MKKLFVIALLFLGLVVVGHCQNVVIINQYQNGDTEISSTSNRPIVKCYPGDILWNGCYVTVTPGYSNYCDIYDQNGREVLHMRKSVELLPNGHYKTATPGYSDYYDIYNADGKEIIHMRKM